MTQAISQSNKQAQCPCGRLFTPLKFTRQGVRHCTTYCSRACANRGKAKPTDVRFWASMNRRGEDECWLWLGKISSDGYGQFNTRTEHRQAHGLVAAHRVAWIVANGSIGEGLCVLHRCDVRNCVNPKHLFLGTTADNTEDMMVKGRGKYGPNRPSMQVDKVAVLTERVNELTQANAALRYELNQLKASSAHQRSA